MKQEELSKEKFFEQVKTYISNDDSLMLINKAYDFAYDKHLNQKRASGEPYFIHLLYVAYELAKLHADPNTICSGLLHDTIEDCGVTEKELTDTFNHEIFEIVEAVSKIGKLKFQDEKEYQAANHRKILIAMAKDVRVILVKLVDRLHNMRTLHFLPEEKQKRIAKETLDVYAPIAHRLGIAEIKNELEDLSFMYLDNERYHEIAKLVESKKSERDFQLKIMMEDISIILDDKKIPFRIFGRSKHLYSINKKMITKNKRFDEILDLLAIRIVTKTELNCYEILGYIHATYRPIPGRLKDYIAMPKMNMYQSLHTTIVGPDGRIYEVQIRTEEMDEIAERGIAAHWSYKENSKKSNQDDIMKELQWLKAFEDSQGQDASEYMNDVTHDIFNANIYTLTPRGRVIDLPNGATPIDFAYRIHTEVGNQTVGAIVNGVLVPLNTPLKTGDVVELKTNKNSTPSEDWLKIAKSNHAKNKIKAFFAKKELEDKEENIKLGESLYKQELIKHNLDVDDYFDVKKLEKVYKVYEVKDYHELMFAIGCKSLAPLAVIEKITKLAKKEINLEDLEKITKKNKEKQAVISKTGIVVKGVSSMKIALAPCCSPVYGDEIVGFVSKGKGIKVHRVDCPNIVKEKRLIEVNWDENKPSNIRYEACLKILAKDRSYLLSDLITVIAQYKANIMAVNIVANAEDLTANASLTITVDNLENLEVIMANLRKVDSVISVERAIK